MKICPICKKKYDESLSFCPRDSEVLVEDRAGLLGKVLDGQYEIEAFIAEGGMGAVYLARHTMLGDKVAIKILPQEMRKSPEWLKRFQREGQAARRFRHPNAVVVHDLRMSSDGDIYLVMEYVEGRTLDKIVSAFGGRLLPTASIRIIEQVSAVLDEAHAMGVVHRDLKPSNIMVTTEGGVVKLLDLGIAKIMDNVGEVGVLTTAGQLLGTPPYMSPEQWGEIPHDGGQEIDGRSDVYSLGVMIYQITAGVHPFKGVSVLDYRRGHCKETAEELDKIVKDLPFGWSDAVKKALEKDRADRFSKAGEFADELRDAVVKSGMLPGDLLARESSKTTILSAPKTLGDKSLKTDEDVTKMIGGAKSNATDELKTKPDIKIESATKLISQTGNEAATNLMEREASGAIKVSTGGIKEKEEEKKEEVEEKKENVVVSSQLPLPEKKPFIHPLIWIGGVIFLVFIVAAIAIFSSIRQASRSTITNQRAAPIANIDVEPKPTPTPTPDDTPFMRYHFLVGSDTGAWKAGDEPFQPAQNLQFVFWSNQNGHIYAIGYDKDGKMKAYPLGGLSAGVPINASQGLTAPVGSKIKLDPKEGETVFTIIFSLSPLEIPFAKESLSLDGSARKLTQDEQKKIEQLKTESIQTNIKFTDDKETKEAIVTLNEKNLIKPIVFDLKLELKK